jgi:hypothetical protein
MKKKCGIVLIIALLVMLMMACSEKENVTGLDPNIPHPPDMADKYDDYIRMPLATSDFSIYTFADPPIRYVDSSTPETNVDAISLDQFILKSRTDGLVPLRPEDAHLDTRKLFTYRMVANDGWSPWGGGRRSIDVTWDFISKGYFVPSKRDGRTYKIEWYNDDNLRNYCVQRMGNGKIELYRTVFVTNPTGTKEILFQLNSLPVVDATNNAGATVPGVRLRDLITRYVTDTPESFDYVIAGLDGAPFIFEWADMEIGYFILSEDRTFVPGKGGQFRVRHPLKISLVRADE